MMQPVSRLLRVCFLGAAICAPASAAHASEAAPASDVPIIQEQRLDCSRLAGDLYWFCNALDRRNCGVAAQAHYWFCKAISERKCNLAERSDYWECRALTERQCNYAETDRYWSCKGFTEDCALAPDEDRDFCYAIAPVYRNPSPWVSR